MAESRPRCKGRLDPSDHDPDLSGVCSRCHDRIDSVPRAPHPLATPADDRGDRAEAYNYYYNPDGVL